jgi:hypothetical protein
VSVSYGQPGAAGQGADWFGPLAPIMPLAPPQVSGRQWDYPSGRDSHNYLKRSQFSVSEDFHAQIECQAFV